MQSHNELHTLLMQHKTEEVITRLQQDAKEINESNDLGLCLLQIAAREGLNDAVAFLCFAGANPAQQSTINHDDKTVCEQAGKSSFDLAQEFGHELTVKIIKAFIGPAEMIDQTILKALYVLAIKTFDNPEKLTLPFKPDQSICQGLLELAAFLNKSLWADFILNCHENFKLRQSVNVRTPAYWAAFHDNEELFTKVSLKNEDNLALTYWQLNEVESEKFKKYTEREEIQAIVNLAERIPEDKESFSEKHAYLLACKNNKTLEKYPYTTKYKIARHALLENNFIALINIQGSVKDHIDFLGQAVGFQDWIYFDVVTRGTIYYDSILKLKTKNHHNFLETLGKLGSNRGILHYIISLHINKGQLSDNEQAIYNALSKNDKIVEQIVLYQVQVKNPNSSSQKNLEQQRVILKILNLDYLNKAKEKKITISKFDNNLLFYIFSFLTGEVIKKVNSEEETEETQNLSLLPDTKKPTNERKIDREELKEISLNKHSIAQSCKMFYAGLSSDSKNEAKKLSGKIEKAPDLLKGLIAELETLMEFKNQLDKENAQKIKWTNRFGAAWRGFIVGSTSLMVILNSIWINKSHNDQINISNDLSLIKTALKICLSNLTYSCYDFYTNGWFSGCKPIDQCEEILHPRDFKIEVPSICNNTCSEASSIDNNMVGGMIVMISGSGPIFLCSLYYLFTLISICRGTWFTINKLHSKPLSSYSTLLTEKISRVDALLPSDAGILNATEMKTALERVESVIQKKSTQLIKQEEKIGVTQRRKKLFEDMFPTKNKLEKKAESKSSENSFVVVNITEDPPKVANTKSVNDSDWKTSLLQHADDEDIVDPQNEPRPSLCSRCVIL